MMLQLERIEAEIQLTISRLLMISCYNEEPPGSGPGVSANQVQLPAARAVNLPRAYKSNTTR
jgi:hypothetical protein